MRLFPKAKLIICDVWSQYHPKVAFRNNILDPKANYFKYSKLTQLVTLRDSVKADKMMECLDLMHLNQSGCQSSWKPTDVCSTEVQEGSEVLAMQNILYLSPTKTGSVSFWFLNQPTPSGTIYAINRVQLSFAWMRKNGRKALRRSLKMRFLYKVTIFSIIILQ